uniref:Uncharacterized protein n=1 Tax=Timema cristinae TaxID=61476 RepID=A0A7R9D7D0_TIMCR|nr:unnamed protein product [Timema cristinae]
MKPAASVALAQRESRGNAARRSWSFVAPFPIGLAPSGLRDGFRHVRVVVDASFDACYYPTHRQMSPIAARHPEGAVNGTFP